MLIEEFLDLNHIMVRSDPKIPLSVRACCYHDDDGNDYVLYNPALSRDAALKALEHELLHIVNNEMYDEDYKEYEPFPSKDDLEFVKRLARAWTMAARDIQHMYDKFAQTII